MVNLNRLLKEAIEKNPEFNIEVHLKKIGINILNSVEMSAQEAAWFLLRQNMSQASREIVYIPTNLPFERQKCRKSNKQMNDENLEAESKDVWTKNVIERYEERTTELESLYLAEFAAFYTKSRASTDKKRDDEKEDEEGDDFDLETNNNHSDEDDEDTEQHPNQVAGEPSKIKIITCKYTKRSVPRIIRYRNYKKDQPDNFKREMVLMFYPFRCEHSELMDNKMYLEIYANNEEEILNRRKLYENNIDIEKEMKISKQCAFWTKIFGKKL